MNSLFMSRMLPFILLVLTLAAGEGRAQMPGSANIPAYRYLFLYDISSSMAKVAPEGRQAIADLIYGGIQGQLKPGDIFSVWPFHQQVYTNRFAPMTWHPGAHQALADSTMALLKILRNEKVAKMDVLWREVAQTARASDLLTVMLISDGDENFQGTPFDAVLNRLLKEHVKSLRRAKKPFLATLVAVKGQFVAYTIGQAGEPIDFSNLNRQMARIFPPAPPAPLVTNIITTNIIIITNIAPPAVAPVVATNTGANPDVPSPSEESKAKLVSSVPTNSEAQGVFTPPPLKPAKTNRPAATVPPATPTPPTEEQSAPMVVTASPPLQAVQPIAQSNPPPDKTEAPKLETATIPNPIATMTTNIAPTVQASTNQATNEELAPIPAETKSIAPSLKKEATPSDPLNRNGEVFIYVISSVGIGLAVFLIIRRGRRRRPHPSFISQSIDKHLH